MLRLLQLNPTNKVKATTIVDTEDNDKDVDIVLIDESVKPSIIYSWIKVLKEIH